MSEKRTDRDRVLMNIALDTSGSIHDTMKRRGSGWTLRFSFDRPAPQFIPEEMAKAIEMPLIAGDIVRCCTNPNHEWGISEFVEWTNREHGESLLREIGGTRLLRMGNERLDVLRFMAPHRLYTGTKHKLYTWAYKAFRERYNPDAEYTKRCGGVEFDGDQLIIWCRAHIWRMEGKQENGQTTYAQPKKIQLTWSDKTRLKDIVLAMKEQGFADDFEYSTEEPAQGQEGFVKFTRGDIFKAVGSV